MKKLIFYILLLSTLGALPANAQLNPLLTTRLQFVLDSVCNQYNIKGASAAVLIPTVGTWKGVHGTGSDKKPLTSNMLFGIGSNTKTYTSAIILKMQEMGLVSINDTIGKWIHNKPNISGKITIRQLLNHTSGIYSFTNNPHFNDSMIANTKRIWTPEESLGFVMAPSFKPGASWEYSNTNYIIAGIIIKQVMKQPYEVTLRNLILKPQGFNNSIFFPQETTSAPVASQWSMGVNNLYQQPITNIPGWSNNAIFSFAYSAGAIMQTAEDNVNFWHNLYNGQIIAPASFTKMKSGVQIGTGPHGGAILYGLGIFIYNNFISGHTIYTHGGTNVGYINENAVDGTTGISFSVLTNQDSVSNFVVFNELITALDKVTIQMQFAAVELPIATNNIELNMYPNPAADYLNVKISNYKEALTLSLYDFFGRKVMTKQITEGQASIYINELPGGNYIARLTETGGNVAATEKLTIR